MSDDERPRRSWRDVDRQKDRSAHRKEERRDGDRGPRGPRREKSYRAALDRLFESGKIAELVQQKDPTAAAEQGGENRIKALAAIRNATGRDELTAALDAFVAKFGAAEEGGGRLAALPDDMEVLGQALQHRDPNVQLEAMERIDALLERERPKRTRAMLGLLRMIRDVDEDPDLTRLAKRLIERLE